MRISMFRILSATAITALAVVPTAGRAELSTVDVSKSANYVQSDPDTVTLFGTFFAARAFSSTAGQFDGGTLTYPGGNSPVALAGSGNLLSYQTNYYLDTASLDADFPFGTYAFEVTDSQNNNATESASIDYQADAYTADLARVTNFSDLHSLDPTQDFTVTLANGFTPTNAGDLNRTFLTVYDYTTNSYVYDSGVQSPNTVAFTIGGGTLTAGHHYAFEVIFSEAIQGNDAITGLPTLQFFDVRTDGQFALDAAPPVPEPAVAWMMMLGLGTVARVARRRAERA